MELNFQEEGTENNPVTSNRLMKKAIIIRKMLSSAYSVSSGTESKGSPVDGLNEETLLKKINFLYK